MQSSSVLWRDGVHLPQADLWLDPHHAREHAVVTHAHADHMKGHVRALASPATAAMMRLRGATKSQFHTPAWNEVVDFDGAQVSLHPAGHVLGSAQVLVEHDGERVLYSGDFKLREGLSCEPIRVPECDTLVMETTFGLPRYNFPDSCEVVRDIAAWCAEMLSKGRAPVVFCYSLGKGQEVLAGLHEARFPIYLAPTHFKMSELYRDFGVSLPPYAQFESKVWQNKTLDGVLLCAPQCRRSSWWADLRGVRTAYVSGWAMDANAKWKFGTDEAFPLSDHAGYNDLWEYVVRSGARRVRTLHGFDRAFASDLREAGYDACALQDVELKRIAKSDFVATRKTRSASQRCAVGAERAGQLRLF